MKSSPLSQSQTGIYLGSAYRDDLIYHIAYAFRFGAGIDPERLAAAAYAILGYHPALMAEITEDDKGVPCMRQGTRPDIRVERMSDEAYEEYKKHIIGHIDIPGGHLCRFTVVVTPSAVWLVMLVHHIVFDGSSLRVLVRDLSAALRGEELKPEAVDAFRIAERETEARSGEQFDNQKQYYLSTFGDFDSDGSEIYADAKDGIGYSHKVTRLAMPADRFHGGASMANAAMGVTLGAFTGRDDVMFSTIFHGRTSADVADTITMMVRTLPVRCHIGNGVRVSDLLNEMNDQRNRTRAADLYSFADLAAETGFKQSLLFAYQGHLLDLNSICDGFTAERYDIGETGVPLSMQLYLTPEGIDMDVLWDTSLYTEATIDRLVATFDLALQQLCTPGVENAPVASFRLTDDAAERELKGIESTPALDFDRSVPIEGVVARIAREMPDKTALVAPSGRAYTYSELDRTSTVMAAALRKAGVEPGMTVGVMIPRSEWMALIPLAVMKAGAAYMPLDPTFPEERLQFMLDDAGVKFVITVDGLLQKVMPGYVGEVIDASEIAATDDRLTPSADTYDPESPFVILYTSGSTGRPKGVTLTRANILNYCHDYVKITALGAEDRVPAYANFGFDAHMMDLYPTIMAGATLYILDEDTRHDLDALHKFFDQNRISVAFVTTQIAWQLVSLYEFPSLRWLATGGEKLPPLGRQPFRFANLYGPTECTVIATSFEPQGPTDGSVIGRPIPGYELRVLDRYCRRVPRGVPGELVILGAGVGVGYLNRPELTAEKFITIDGRRAYRTGDLVRWNEDGDIQFIGRIDGMVKLRGLRIELGEIEAVATRHPDVRQFVATVKTIGGNEQLVGYYTVKDGAGLTADELRDFLSQDLTEFMIPSAIMQLDALPMTTNGKVDRKALPVPEIKINDEMVPPADDAEREMCEIVSGVIGHDSFGVTTNLLKVGLTSLLAMRLVATIAKRLNVPLKSKQVMADPTVRGIISAIGAASASATQQQSAAKRKYYPITENQRGVLIDWERNRDALQYNVAQVFKIKPDTDIERLQKAIESAVKAHPALNARFVNRSGDIMQQRLAPENITVEHITIDHVPTREDMQALMRPFDLFAEPLYRFVIVHHGQEAWLFMDFHHIVFDGVSAMVFFDSLSKSYSGEALAEETYSAFEWADDEAALLRSAEYEEAEGWFEKLLSDTETTVYPHSTVSEAVESGTLFRLNSEIDGKAIDSFCSSNAITPSNYFLASLMQALHRLTRNETIAITTVNNGRGDVRLVDDIGMFVKTLPVVSRIKPKEAHSLSPVSMALDMQNQFNTTRGYDFYPFTEIVSRYGIRPEIMYVYEGGVSLDAADGPLSNEKISVALDTAKVPLTLLIFTPGEGKYRLELEYDASLYNSADMATLLDMLTTAALTMSSSETVAGISLLSPQGERCLDGIRDGVAGEVPYASYHGAFELQADAAPDATALIATDRTLTYAQLDAEANRIANALRARGVDRGDKVVVLLPRDSRLIASIYGVMKSGAAYIPCDPDYPVERIRLITEDSDAKCIITTADRAGDYPSAAVDVVELLAFTDNSRPCVKIDPDMPAYLIYTSGSTGRPKGVVIHHGAATNYLYGYRKIIYEPMGNDEPKVNMLIVTISFDASHVDLGTSLTSGHTLVLANEEECKDVAMLASLMQRTGVEAFDATPSRLAAMLELPEFCEAISHCKLLNIGGEAIPASLLPKLDAAGFRGLTVNEYGPTECTVGSNHAVLTVGKPVTVGPPFYNYREYVTDAWGGELPVGAVGELVIAGRSVGKGYHNLPDKTAESFIIYHGEPAYRTGDLARRLPDGDVDVLGRIDHQVKLRGLRIELGEIESVANSFPGVKMSVANVCKIQNVDHLCIWYEGENIDPEELRAHLSRHLTEYMVPDSFNPVDRIPVTPNGKLDRKHLPEPVLEELAPYVEPAEGDEATIAEAFRHTLSLDRVGANDDFFKIGGTSINAIKVVAVLAQHSIKIKYKDLFSTKTPRALAELLTHAVTPDTDTAPVVSNNVDEHEEQFAGVLRNGTIEAFCNGTSQAVGNVLLTGATGFLGVHVLHHLLENTDAVVSCVVRSSKSFDASSRLRTLLFYYFGSTYEELFGSRIRIIRGDLNDDDTLAALDPAVIDTVINCAASVKHFAPGREIEHANVDTVRRIVDWCVPKRRRLVHISTVSVAGDAPAAVAATKVLTEQSLDLGQGLSNQYVRSKYDAETIILEAIQNHGLNAKIMRVGNISPRACDGEFQANFRTNAFMGRLRAYLALGCVPYSHLDSTCEFTPVDQLAASIIRLSSTPADNVVFHPLNNHHVPLCDVIDVLNRLLPQSIEAVETAVFAERLSRAMSSDGDAVTLLQPLVAYNSDDTDAAYIPCTAAYTNQILLRLGFRWSPTSTAYISSFIEAISTLGYFDSAMDKK